jgi:hypothetical protein
VPLTTELAAEPKPEPDVETVVERRDVVEYDLSEWSQEQVDELSSQLAIGHVAHEWSRGHLHVPGAHEAAVDDLVDAIDELDDVPDDVQYEFQEWTPQQCEQLVTRLVELGIACVWDGYLLGIGAADEAAVDAEVLKIDPTFPVTDTAEEEPALGLPDRPGWGGIIGDVLGEIGRI